jgi:hypothetical protein
LIQTKKNKNKKNSQFIFGLINKYYSLSCKQTSFLPMEQVLAQNSLVNITAQSGSTRHSDAFDDVTFPAVQQLGLHASGFVEQML